MPKPTATALLTSSLVCIFVAAAPTFSFADTAEAAAVKAAPERAFCRNANQLSSTTKLGSQVDGDIVTICLSRDLLRKLQPARPPGLGAVPVIPVKPKQAPTRQLPTNLPARKPIVLQKPKPKVAKPAASRRNIAGTFRPAVSEFEATPAMANAGSPVSIITSQAVHLGLSRLLGQQVQVRFTPLDLEFDFGDGQKLTVTGSTAAVEHRFATPGRYEIVLAVRFGVEYRLVSGKWFTDPQDITLFAQPREVEILEQGGKQPSVKVVLVTPNR